MINILRIPNDVLIKTDTTIYSRKIQMLQLDLLSRSGTPLFVSCDKNSVTLDMIADLKAAFSRSYKQINSAIPLDWEFNKNPSTWGIYGKIVNNNWIMNIYSSVQKGNDIPPLRRHGCISDFD